MKILDKIKDYNKDQEKKITKILNKKIVYDLIIDEKNDNMLNLMNQKKKVLTGNYTFYGIYKPNSSIWIWGSSIPGIRKTFVKKILKIRKMNYLFEKYDDDINSFFYQFLSQDMIFIPPNKKKEFLNHINNLLVYLGNGIISFYPKADNGYVQFVSLDNIKEIYT